MERTLPMLPFAALILSVMLGACGGGEEGPAEVDSSAAIPFDSILFFEGFETYPVGDFPGGGWRDLGNDYTHKRVDNPPADHKLLLEGPSGEFVGGAQHTFYPGLHPTYVRYQAHPYPAVHGPSPPPGSMTRAGVFWMMGPDAANVNRTALYVMFEYGADGRGHVWANGITYPQQALIPLDRSFRIELRNIDWLNFPSVTFDLWINGHEVRRCIPFLFAAESIRQLDLFNFDYARVHFDSILMADLPLENYCPRVSEDPPQWPAPSIPPLEAPSPSPPIEFPRFLVSVDAFCRLGPGTGYPALDYFPAEAVLTATGQSEDGTWWWIGEFGCWISDAVGELDGDPSTLPLLAGPPLPEMVPGGPSACLSTLDATACANAGGTWVHEPGQPSGSCQCP